MPDTDWEAWRDNQQRLSEARLRTVFDWLQLVLSALVPLLGLIWIACLWLGDVEAKKRGVLILIAVTIGTVFWGLLRMAVFGWAIEDILLRPFILF